MTMKDYVKGDPTQKCLENPTFCEAGLSTSIFVKLPRSDKPKGSPITNPNNTKRYIYSTGGDTIGHPGVALYIEGPKLIAVVSKGKEYWKTTCFDPTKYGVYVNFGIIWSDGEDSDGNEYGLQLFMNAKRVSFQAVRSYAQEALLGHFPTEVIVGCHRTPGNPTYEHFCNGHFDEVIFWERRIKPLYLLGSYLPEGELSTTQLQELADRINKQDPEQISSYLELIKKPQEVTTTPKIPDDDEEPPPKPDPTITTAAPVIDEKEMEDWDSKLEIYRKIMDPEGINKRHDEKAVHAFMGVVQAVDELINVNQKSQWELQSKKDDEYGVMQLVKQRDAYLVKIHSLQPRNPDADPCKVIASKQTINEICKYKLGELQLNKKEIEGPNYRDHRIDHVRTLWNAYGHDLGDVVKCSTKIFPDESCIDRDVTVITTVYRDLDLLAQKNVQEGLKTIRRDTMKNIAGRVTFMSLTVDPAFRSDGTFDHAKPLCNADKQLLYLHPCSSKLVHRNPSPALRRMFEFKFKEPTKVETRHCVLWVKDSGDNGEWSDEECKVLNSNEFFTRCKCRRTGTVAVMEEVRDPMIIPNEPYWLMLTKYILYGISAFAIILYMIVVAVSGDLKDMFHLLGFNLAFTILCTYIILILSDFDFVRTDRHACVAIGALIHFFGSALGFCAFNLGHASFRGITDGIIHGRLGAYMCIAWGGAICVTGVPFILYINQLGLDPRCFIAWEIHIKLIFFVPIMVCALMAIFFACVIICNISSSRLRKDNLIEDYGSFCQGAALLMLLFALTWVMGLLAYIAPVEGVDFYPIFHVLNGTNGIFLFLFIGLGSNRFRTVVQGKAVKRREALKSNAFGYGKGDDKKALKRKNTKKWDMVGDGNYNNAFHDD